MKKKKVNIMDRILNSGAIPQTIPPAVVFFPAEPKDKAKAQWKEALGAWVNTENGAIIRATGHGIRSPLATIFEDEAHSPRRSPKEKVGQSLSPRRVTLDL